MIYVLNSPASGVFIGMAMGLAFFSKNDTAGQNTATTVANPEDAQDLFDMLQKHFPDLEWREVASGHWKDLAAEGIHTGDMEQNELMYAETVGSC